MLAAPAVMARSLELQTQWEDMIAASLAASFGTLRAWLELLLDPDDPKWLATLAGSSARQSTS